MSKREEYKFKRAHVIVAAVALGLNTLLGIASNVRGVWSTQRQLEMSERELVAQMARLEYTIAVECQSPTEGTLVEWLDVRNVGGTRADDVKVSIADTRLEILAAYSDSEELEEMRHKTSVRFPLFSLNAYETYRLRLELAIDGGVDSEETQQMLLFQIQPENLQVTTSSDTFGEPQGAIEEPRGFPERVTHTVTDSETIHGIAEQYGLDVDTLVWYNPVIDLRNDRPVVPGQRLLIQPSVCGQLTTASTTSPQDWQILGYHTVQSGETLFCIARAYGVDPWALAAINGLLTTSLEEQAGLVLALPAVYAPSLQGPVCPRQFPPYPVPPPASCVTYHIVGPGESLASISLRYDVSMWRIATVNGVYNLNYVREGDTLCIPDE
jgi:LysM repeat protein